MRSTLNTFQGGLSVKRYGKESFCAQQSLPLSTESRRRRHSGSIRNDRWYLSKRSIYLFFQRPGTSLGKPFSVNFLTDGEWQVTFTVMFLLFNPDGYTNDQIDMKLQ